jgi:ribosome-associated translation inhibitor RaiA
MAYSLHRLVRSKENSMQRLQIHWLEMPPSVDIEAKIRQRADRLTRYSRDIQRIEVWVDAARGHHRKGELYSVRIRLTVPGEEIAVDLQPSQEDVRTAIREAFDASRRKLEDFERRRRGDVKTHARPRRKAEPA